MPERTLVRVLARSESRWSFNALKNLVALASLAWAFLACERKAATLSARDRRLKPDKRPAFAFYSILAGWQNLFSPAKSALYKRLAPRRTAATAAFYRPCESGKNAMKNTAPEFLERLLSGKWVDALGP